MKGVEALGVYDGHHGSDLGQFILCEKCEFSCLVPPSLYTWPAAELFFTL